MAIAPFDVVTPVTPSTVPTVRPAAPPLPRTENELPGPVTFAATTDMTFVVAEFAVGARPRSSVVEPTLLTLRFVSVMVAAAPWVIVPPDRSESVDAPAGAIAAETFKFPLVREPTLKVPAV